MKTKFILVLNGKPIKSFICFISASRCFDKYLSAIDPTRDSLELWSYGVGVVRAI